MTHEIAVYGKGGIGKSTIAANISAMLSARGCHVLQIGCDPKHDSTRLLMGGRKIEPVLDYIKRTNPLDYRLESILSTGYCGTGCIEAGGPKPGVGCAGRGIITAFRLLDQFHIKDMYDLILYDVLGDVVCGGFAVPIRREYADTIFLVTSGEFMSIYAANNILRGIGNYDDGRNRTAGILYNARGLKDEDSRVSAFADAVHLPVIAKIPRDNIFERAEKAGCTLEEYKTQEDSPLREIFQDLAGRILRGPELYPSLPLTDEHLEELVMGTSPYKASLSISGVQKETSKLLKNQTNCVRLSKNVIRDEPLHGCAFNGAMTMGVHLCDAAIIAHGPKSCTYLSFQTINSTGRRRLFERGILLPSSISPNIISTDMDETDMVFGGTDKLLDAVSDLISLPPSKQPKAVIIISTCASGIIGDDIEKAKALSTPDLPVITIKTDGNLSGDFMQGMIDCYTQLAEQVIDPSVQAEPDTVNVIFEKVVARNCESNYKTVEGYLNALGIRVNCRFLCNTSYESLRRFRCASLNLPAYLDYTGKILVRFFRETYGSAFYDRQFPVGFAETEQWLSDLGRFFGKQETAELLIADSRKNYTHEIDALRPALAGKKLMIITYNHNLDWILRAALDADIEIVKLCILNFSQDEGFRTMLPEAARFCIEENYDPDKRAADVAALKPDMILSNYESSVARGNCLEDNIPACPDVGFYSGLDILKKWVKMFGMNSEGEWKNDQSLFNKYYAG